MLVNANMLNTEESTAKVANIQQIIMAINALSKVFFSIFDFLLWYLLHFIGGYISKGSSLKVR